MIPRKSFERLEQHYEKKDYLAGTFLGEAPCKERSR